ncbi:hypothetical protein ACHAWF_011087 [Thalassiosira exigua]
MFGSSFASSLPPASAPSGAAAGTASSSSSGVVRGSSSSSGGGGGAKRSAAPAPALLPFAGFGGGFGGLGGAPPSSSGGVDGGAGSKSFSSSAASGSSSSGDGGVGGGRGGFGFGGGGGGGGFGGGPPFSSSSSASPPRKARGRGVGVGASVPLLPSASASSASSVPPGLPFDGFVGVGFGGVAGVGTAKGASGGPPPPSTSTPPSSFSAAAARAARSSAARGGRSGGAAAAKAPSEAASTAAGALVPRSEAAPSSFAAAAAAGRGGAGRASIETSCASPDGRSFHSYVRDPATGRHSIVSDFAPFGDAATIDGTGDLGGGGGGRGGSATSSLRVTAVLPPAVAEAIDVDPPRGLVCVDGSDNGGGGGSRGRRRRGRKARGGGSDGGGDDSEGGGRLEVLPWMCLYSASSAFLLSVGYPRPDDDDDGGGGEGGTKVEGRVLRVLEPFEKHVRSSPRGSEILRVRPAPSSDAMFQRPGAAAMLLREGANGAEVGHSLALYHGLPDSDAGGGGGAGGDVGGGRGSSASGEGSVTVPLRFDREDLARGAEDTTDAEDEAYRRASAPSRDGPPPPPSSEPSPSSPREVVDFCFLNPPSSESDDGAGLASLSILAVTADGAAYAASPVLFDGTVVPRSVVVDAAARLDDEIDAWTSVLGAASPTPAPSDERERAEARTRQCRAARRYLIDAFGVAESAVRGGAAASGGSYYVRASALRRRPQRESASATSWHPRLQGPLVLPPPADSDADADASPPCACVEPFGGTAGGGIVHGFVVARSFGGARSGAALRVDFGVLPGEGSAVLPRFEFEDDADRRVLDDLVQGTRGYVARAAIADEGASANGTSSLDGGGGGRGSRRGRSVEGTVERRRGCSLVVEPLDDLMVHVATSSRIVTVTTDAMAAAPNDLKARLGDGASAAGNEADRSGAPRSVSTKAWSCLEMGAGGSPLSGAGASGDVRLGHLLPRARVQRERGSLQHHRRTEKAKPERRPASSVEDDEALEVLCRVQPLSKLLPPPIDRIGDGLSKMEKIAGGATLPRDAGPEDLSVVLETRRSCEEDVLAPMEEAGATCCGRCTTGRGPSSRDSRTYWMRSGRGATRARSRAGGGAVGAL